MLNGAHTTAEAAAVTSFIQATTPTELNNAFDELALLGIVELTCTHESRSGITFISLLPVIELYQLFIEHLLESEAEAMDLAHEEGANS
jgi:hypothetical protein